MGVPADLRLRVPPRPTAPIAQPAKIGDPQDFKVVNLSHSPTNTGAIVIEQKPIGFNGSIISVQITNIANNDRKQGDTWSQAEIYRGLVSDPEQPNQNKLYTLCRGGVTANRGPSGYGALPVMASDILVIRSWNRLSGRIGLRLQGLPGPTLPPNWAGEFSNPEDPDVGRLRVISLGDPAAGSDYTAEPVPANVRWRLKGFAGTLVTDANAANRRVCLVITDGTDEISGTAPRGTQPANQTNLYRYGTSNNPGAFVSSVIAGARVFLASMTELGFLDEAFTVGVDTENIQAGDNWGEGFISVEERLLAQ